MSPIADDEFGRLLISQSLSDSVAEWSKARHSSCRGANRVGSNPTAVIMQPFPIGFRWFPSIQHVNFWSTLESVWSNGYDVRLTRERFPVRSWALIFFWLANMCALNAPTKFLIESGSCVQFENFRTSTQPVAFRDSIVVSISACHADDPGSIPGRGVFLLQNPKTFQSILQHRIFQRQWQRSCDHHRSRFGSRSERGDAFAQPFFFEAFDTRTKIKTKLQKANSTLRASRAVPHPSTDRAFRRLTSEFGWDRVHSTKYGRWRKLHPEQPQLSPTQLRTRTKN